MDLKDLYARLREEIGKVVFGQDEVVELALAGLFSGGHVLLEGMPGTAKTLLVRVLASALDLGFSRVQMTPDLLPGDITGSAIYRDDTHEFVFQRGAVFSNFLLADELNRASAKTQSALLEAMQELHVTVDGKTYPLPEPFMVFATENPVEQEGTYPLPLAQLDRFMFKVQVGYPDGETEERIYRSHHAGGVNAALARGGITKLLGPAEILEAREIIAQTFVRDEVASYVRRLMQATRSDEALASGASPRAGLMLLMGAKSLARFAGRDYVTPDDVKECFLPAIAHRVTLAATAEIEGARAEDVLVRLLNTVEVPR
ncbi:MAG: MoxR family ATPase [Planctomycetes bacterium]|nr:MoxR family ATPase [Planctomycetota bacterium]